MLKYTKKSSILAYKKVDIFLEKKDTVFIVQTLKNTAFQAF